MVLRILYRAFHAYPESYEQWQNSNQRCLWCGEYAAQYDEDSFLLNVLRSFFDAKGKTFRDDMYSEYKANRPSMPQEH